MEATHFAETLENLHVAKHHVGQMGDLLKTQEKQILVCAIHVWLVLLFSTLPQHVACSPAPQQAFQPRLALLLLFLVQFSYLTLSTASGCTVPNVSTIATAVAMMALYNAFDMYA